VVTEAELTAHSESYKHKYHWETSEEVQIISPGESGEQSFGSPPSLADHYIRIKEMTIRNSGGSDTVIQLLAKIDGGYNVKLSIDVPKNTTREWESEQGRRFSYGEQPVVRATAVGGTIYLSGSGIEASEVSH
jgi:hypothetical protein